MVPGVPGIPTVASVATVYGTVLAGALSSWLVLAVAFRVFGIRPAQALLWTAAAAVGAYYWFTPAAIVEAWGLPPLWLAVLRSAALLLVGAWIWRALVTSTETPLVPVRLER